MAARDALEGKRIGFIGAGSMGEALAGALVQAGVPAERILAADPDPGRRKRVEQAFGLRTTDANEDVAEEADLIVLAVKPDRLAVALAALGGPQRRELAGPLWISIAAGVTLERVEAALPEGARAVRAMPNTPAQVHAGATALFANARSGSADRAAARALFEAVGSVWEAPTEGHLDAVTGLSGSGPAFVFVFLEALADAGVRVGLPRDAALHLASQTVFGSAKLLLESGRHPAQLKDQVTTPGGTTIAGLERLEAGGLRAAVYEAVAAATRRSRELRGA